MEDPVLERRSIRKFTDQPVSEDHVTTLLKAAMSAPSAGNEQPWHFVVIRERSLLDAVASFHPYARMITQAPVASLVCGDLEREKSKGFWVEDCSAATENILIEAQQIGLGSVWLGVYPREDRVENMRRIIAGMPENAVPFALVPVGYPAESKRPSDRWDESRVHYGRW
jgi:nitroreductase